MTAPSDAGKPSEDAKNARPSEDADGVPSSDDAKDERPSEGFDAASGSGAALFVRRPILAFVISALMILAGVGALFGVEVRELPNVASPVVTIRTDFPGAAPETVDQEITSRIEGAVGRVQGIKAISSESRFGESRVTLTFRESTDIDIAATDSRDAVNRILNRFPSDAETPRVVKADADAQPIVRIAVTSPGRSPQELTDIVRERVEDRLISIEGVADLQIYGARDPVFRIDIDMSQLASRGLTLADLRRALADVAYDAPAGDLTGSRQTISVRTTATVDTEDAFESLTIAPNVILGDVAQVTLGPRANETVLRANGQTGIGLGIIRQATSNTLEISAAVRAEVEALSETLPSDVSIFVTSDDAVFINGAITEVLRTLGMAIGIVVVVIFLFLRSARATLVPALAIPVALVGTLAAIYLVGFSINILTLLALVLATGLVVDDAIVVLENIVRRRSEGMGPRAAAVLGTRQVFFAVITTTATLAAVFVPLSFLPGEAGGLFREFGFTLAMAVALSSVVALTLCPVLASRLLDAPLREHRFDPLAWIGKRLVSLYAVTLRAALAVPLVIVLAAGLFAATAGLVVNQIQQELTPREDRAVALLIVRAPQGVSLDYTVGKMREIEAIADPLREAGEVTNVFSIAGFGADNSGFMVFTLAPWEERARSQNEIVGEINRGLFQLVGVRAFAIQPNSLGIRGAGRGLSFAITGDSYEQLAEKAEEMVAQMNQNPAFGGVRLEYETTQPQLSIEIDRTRASDLGIDITGLGEALRAVLDGRTVGSVFIDDQSFDIQMMSTSDPVNDPGDLRNVFIEADDGTMVPMSSFVTLEERAVAPELTREGQNRSVKIEASLTPDFALGDALAETRAIGEDVLDPENRIVALGEAATLDETSGGLLVIFGFALAVVLLVLAAQFESLISAVVVMVTVPLGLACAVFALLFTGLSLNVYSQIGLIMLIGIMAKNGILIVEFANQLRDQGAAVRDAILEASTVRLRPVTMTMVSTVLGGLPLILSTGAGAEARGALGWVIVGGLGLATLSTLYLTPVAYLLLARFSKPRAEEERRLTTELSTAMRSAASPSSVS